MEPNIRHGEALFSEGKVEEAEKCFLGLLEENSENGELHNNLGVILEDDVFCGPSMVFTNVINPRSQISRKHEFKNTLVKKGATIGANATIICGNTIGRHAFIGAGTIVTKDVPDYALMLGNPANITGWMCECGHQINFNDNKATCNYCEKQYMQTEEGVKPLEDEWVMQHTIGGT